MIPGNLTDWLTTVPEPEFWKDGGASKPDYNNVFAYLIEKECSGLVGAEMFKSGELPNLSTFQRQVAREASRRRSLYN